MILNNAGSARRECPPVAAQPTAHSQICFFGTDVQNEDDVMKVNVALIGSGNIGTDLMVKALRSARLAPVWMVGIDPASDGLSRARTAGLQTTAQGLDGLLPHLARDRIRIAFDATSAYIHHEHARRLREHGVAVIDLTPAAVGPYCVPPVNLAEHAGRGEMNVNMVSCGGQRRFPSWLQYRGCSRSSTPKSSPRWRRAARVREHARTSMSSLAPPRAASRKSAVPNAARPSSFSIRLSRRC